MSKGVLQKIATPFFGGIVMQVKPLGIALAERQVPIYGQPIPYKEAMGATGRLPRRPDGPPRNDRGNLRAGCGGLGAVGNDGIREGQDPPLRQTCKTNRNFAAGPFVLHGISFPQAVVIAFGIFRSGCGFTPNIL